MLPLGIHGIPTVNGYLIADAHSATLVDCGIWTGDTGDRGTHVLQQGLDECGFTLAQLRRLVITHAHIDHYGIAGEVVRQGIIRVPAHNTPIKTSRREVLLIAIAKARQWIDDLAHGRAASFAVIARREGKAERHIRLLAPLAFVSPRIVSALLDGTAPADLTLTKLARALPYCWVEQERRVHLQRFPCSLD
jgi:glyoxylase-like metal-dependent hydrolase (beta-lactamase superfamily II)